MYKTHHKLIRGLCLLLWWWCGVWGHHHHTYAYDVVCTCMRVSMCHHKLRDTRYASCIILLYYMH